jgi:hypothetical protein
VIHSKHWLNLTIVASAMVVVLFNLYASPLFEAEVVATDAF